MSQPRMTTHTQTVLRALLGRGTDAAQRSTVLADGIYGLDLVRTTGLPNGTLFPVLERLVQCGWVERYWEQDAAAEAHGRPRRRYYRITHSGAQLAAEALDAVQQAAGSAVATGPLRPGLAGGR
jgi:PadR family transcriptional regulator, regulatory protein PadR